MTKLQPITSEEVLARQVKENAQKAAAQADSLDARQTAPGAVADMERPASLSQKPTSGELLSSTKNVRNIDNETADKSGYNYRLPLGAYLLSFVYIQICIFSLCSIILTVITHMHYVDQGNTTLYDALGVISRGTWITTVVTATLALLIFSGSNVLRWCVISGATIIAATLTYQVIASVLSNSDSYALGYPISLFVYGAGILLCAITVFYLLRKKVAAAYE